MTSTDRFLSSGSGHVLLVVACRGINDTPRGSRAMLTRRQLALQNAEANLPSAPSLHSHSRAPQHLVLAHFYVLATNSSSRAPACSRAAHDRCLEVSCAPIPLGSRLTRRVTGPNPSRLNSGTCDKRLQVMTPQACCLDSEQDVAHPRADAGTTSLCPTPSFRKLKALTVARGDVHDILSELHQTARSVACQQPNPLLLLHLGKSWHGDARGWTLCTPLKKGSENTPRA